MSDLYNRGTEEKINIGDDKRIISYLSLLENFYQQSQDKSKQERLFRINKAINSIKKYSNCKVSSFNFKPSKTNNNESISEVPSKKEKDIEDILLFIEKELKENGINENDINNSSLDNSKKLLNPSDNLEIANENISVIECNSKAEKIPKSNINQRRLSKLFIKLELKLKTFLQEYNMKKDEENNDANFQQNIKEDNIFAYSLGRKITKSPSKLPNVIDSFFSDKNKVNSILQKVKNQRRKSVMDFNMKYCKLSEDLKEDQYITDSDDKDKNAQKRKKIVPCSAQVVLRNKATKKFISEKVSNFCDMIDEKEEEKEDIEDINAFDEVIKEDEENEKMNHDNNIMTEKDDIIKIGNDSSIKISSSLSNKDKDKLYFNNKQNNNRNIISNIINDKENKIDEDYYVNNDFYVSKTSIFNNENEWSNTINNNENSLLDDEILMESSEKKEKNNSQNEEESKESGENFSNQSENNNNIDERYNILKYINDSKNRPNLDGSEEKFENNISDFGKNNSDFHQQNSLKREVTRASNINAFCINSILSPLKDVEIFNKNIHQQNTTIEEFTKFNP